MPADLIISIMAEDRPGLVERISDLVTRHKGNWVDSSLARLGGEFAGIIRVDLPDAAAANFETDLEALEGDGISATVRRVAPSTKQSGRVALFELSGSDHPGIVHQISSALAAHNVSIDELHTQILPGSMSGAQIFAAKGRLILPDTLTLEAVRQGLEEIAQDMLVELTFNEGS